MRTSGPARRRAAAMAAAGLAILAAGCGASTSTSGTPASTASARPSANPLASLTADQIITKADADLKAASSVQVAGPIADSGQTYILNLTLGPRGCKGTMSMPKKGSFQLLKIGKKLWFKGNHRFWEVNGGTSDPAVLKFLEGKAIEVSATGSGLAAFGTLCDPRQLAAAFAGSAGGVVKGATSVISGQPALQLKDTGDGESAYVTISAHPEFVRLDAGRQGHLDFTAYDAPLTLTPPPASQTIDGARYGF